MKVRRAQFSGSWYPGNAADCEREIKRFIQSGEATPPSDRPWVGGIVPHAGWYFSGSIACNVIRCLIGKKQPDVFVVFGMHLHPRSSNYIMTEGAWAVRVYHGRDQGVELASLNGQTTAIVLPSLPHPIYKVVGVLYE